MRICFVSDGGVGEFLQAFEKGGECAREEQRADVYLFAFNGSNEVSYERELKGETVYFEEIARLSKLSKSVVVCGCVTDTRGHKRKSAVVAENGRIAGVSDMIHAVDGEVASGAALRVYETAAGRMGVAVADDLDFPGVIKSLSVCGSDFVVCPHRSAEEIQQVLLRAHAYCYGVPIFFCATGYAMIADVAGNVAFSSPLSPAFADFENKKEYHLVETRRRGFYKPRKD